MLREMQLKFCEQQLKSRAPWLKSRRLWLGSHGSRLKSLSCDTILTQFYNSRKSTLVICYSSLVGLDSCLVSRDSSLVNRISRFVGWDSILMYLSVVWVFFYKMSRYEARVAQITDFWVSWTLGGKVVRCDLQLKSRCIRFESVEEVGRSCLRRLLSLEKSMFLAFIFKTLSCYPHI